MDKTLYVNFGVHCPWTFKYWLNQQNTEHFHICTYADTVILSSTTLQPRALDYSVFRAKLPAPSMKCLRMPSCCATRNGTAYGPTSGGSTPLQTVRTWDSSQSKSLFIELGFIAITSSSRRDGLDITNTQSSIGDTYPTLRQINARGRCYLWINVHHVKKTVKIVFVITMSNLHRFW